MNNHDIPSDQNLIRHQSEYYTTSEFIDKMKLAPGNTHDLDTSLQHDTHFSLLHVNVRSLSKNYDDLSALLSILPNFNFQIIGVTETWLHSDSPPIFNLDNYDMIRTDRALGRGGGVAIYVSNQFNFRRRPDLHVEGAEDIFIEIDSDTEKNVIIGVIYRPPNKPIDSFLDKFDEFSRK